MTTVTDPRAIRIIQLSTQRAAVRLEAKGLRRSGPSVTSLMKKAYGLPRHASYEDVLASIDDDLNQQAIPPFCGPLSGVGTLT